MSYWAVEGKVRPSFVRVGKASLSTSLESGNEGLGAACAAVLTSLTPRFYLVALQSSQRLSDYASIGRFCLIGVAGCLLTLIRRRLQFTHPMRDFVWLLLEWNTALSYSEVPSLVETLADFELYFALTLNTVFICAKGGYGWLFMFPAPTVEPEWIFYSSS